MSSPRRVPSAPSLAGRTALVTGASRGIGIAIARALAHAGARVALLSRHERALRTAAEAMKSLDGGENPPRVLGLACDLANGESVDAAVRHLLDAWPVVDILVNNAGAFALGKIGEAPPDEAERMFAVNAVGPFRLLHALVPAMKARGDGHVVTIGSVADRHAYAENAAYAATKHGMRAIHEVMREELRGSGVRATLVSPGPVDTALWDPIRPEERAGFPARSQMLRSEDVAEAVLFALTRPRHVNVDELRLTRS